jgi:hypothetical protein
VGTVDLEHLLHKWFNPWKSIGGIILVEISPKNGWVMENQLSSGQTYGQIHVCSKNCLTYYLLLRKQLQLLLK